MSVKCKMLMVKSRQQETTKTCYTQTIHWINTYSKKETENTNFEMGFGTIKKCLDDTEQTSI